MKERQRWQPEEDALLRAYVRQYGPKEWNLISQRMGSPLHRDPKSCLERWKNYLKPGIKKGSLTPDEQDLVISLQAKYGNKWKKIASEVPGRTAKRLGKWWEVFKEKQLKQIQGSHAGASSPEVSGHGKYDHILDTFAEKYVQNALFAGNLPIPETPPVLSLSPVRIPEQANSTGAGLPVWMNVNVSGTPSSSLTSSSSTPSPAVSLTPSPSEPAVLDSVHPDPPRIFFPFQQARALVQELEEGREIWVRHRKEATWRLSRLEQQLESEKARRRMETMAEVEEKVRRLREEETAFVSRLEGECREEVKAVRREAEAKEEKLMEAWCNSHVKLARLIGAHICHGPPNSSI